jgi:hypothetical protein
MVLDSEIWGPKYWFFLHTVAQTYPIHPNAITKRKYYDLISNLPLFIPDTEMGDRFAQLLDKYPVTPYLDNRDSFMKWMHFIHNKVNVLLGKEEISYLASLDKYNAEYKTKPVKFAEKFHIHKRYIHIGFIFLLLFLIYFFYS